MIAILLLLPDFDIRGPAILAAADPGVLERVAQRRLNAGWGLSEPVDSTLVAVPGCADLDRTGWLITNGEIYDIWVVDCAKLQHREAMIKNGLLADVNAPLSHQVGWLILE